jgi:DNA-binding MarR family transcriptional regulator
MNKPSNAIDPLRRFTDEQFRKPTPSFRCLAAAVYIGQLFIEGEIPPSLSEAAEYLGVSPAAFTAIADRLTDEGLVTKVRQDDRRVIRLRSTNKLRNAVRKLNKRTSNLYDSIRIEEPTRNRISP